MKQLYNFEVPPPGRKKWLVWSGSVLIVVSCLLYGSLLVVPFLPLSAPIKIALFTVLIILGETTFWIGGSIVGGSIIARYRRYLNPMHLLRTKPSTTLASDKQGEGYQQYKHKN